MRKDNCVFCQIVAKEIPAKIVYEDDDLIAFLDIDPVAEGHTLIIPKSHADDIFHIEASILSKIAATSKKISEKIYEVLQPEGINVLQNNREAAGQIILHYHMHIIPRWNNDGFRAMVASAPPKNDLFSMLDATLKKIKLS